MTTNTTTITRSAGTALLVYGIGTTVGYFGAGGPGGDFEPTTIAGYTAPSHYPVAVALWYLGAFAALALIPFARELRKVSVEHPFPGLSLAAGAAGTVSR